MKQGIALLVAAVALVGVVGMAAAGPVGTAVAQDDPVATNETSEGNETANGTDISPGERLSGVIGVQRAEIAGEVDSRAFEVALNRTETAEERAAVVADRLNRTEERLDEIERRQRELREQREAGELSRGEFAARMAETGARAETVERAANRSTDVARKLPESVRADRGLNESRLGELRERASEASGPEVAAIARRVAGNDVGGPLAADRRGPPENAGRGNGPGAGNGSGTVDGPAGDGPAGDGPSDRGNGAEADGNATNATVDLTNEARVPMGGSGNASDGGRDGDGADRSDGGGQGDGADRSDGGDTGTATPSGDGASPPAGDDNRGAGNASGSDASGAGAVNAVAERLTEPLTDGAEFVRRVVGNIDG